MAAARQTDIGYVAVEVRVSSRCQSPVGEHGYLVVRPHWATKCFYPAYLRSREAWGPNDDAIVMEVMAELEPGMRIYAPQTGAEVELLRRVRLAVAALLNSDGIPVSYPPDSRIPRPLATVSGPPWYRGLMTGWLH